MRNQGRPRSIDDAAGIEPSSDRARLSWIIGARSPIHIELGRLKSMTYL